VSEKVATVYQSVIARAFNRDIDARTEKPFTIAVITYWMKIKMNFSLY